MMVLVTPEATDKGETEIRIGYLLCYLVGMRIRDVILLVHRFQNSSIADTTRHELDGRKSKLNIPFAVVRVIDKISKTVC